MATKRTKTFVKPTTTKKKEQRNDQRENRNIQTKPRKQKKKGFVDTREMNGNRCQQQQQPNPSLTQNNQQTKENRGLTSSNKLVA